MTIDEAWTIVLEKYHDELPLKFKWRPFSMCSVPRPKLTDAAAVAVLRVVKRRGYCFAYDADGTAELYVERSSRYKGSRLIQNDDPRDAIILAAAELAQRK